MHFQKNAPGKYTARFEFSIGTAVGLLLLLAFTCLLGTFPTEFIADKVPGFAVANALIRLTRFAGGRDLYGSPFFLFLLACVFVFLAEAVLRQLRILLSNKESLVSQAVFPALPLTIQLHRNGEEARKKTAAALKFLGVTPTLPPKGPAPAPFSFHSVKNGFGVWGAVGVHVGLLVVLAAGLVTMLGADVREVDIREGASLYLPRERVNLGLEKFSIIPYPGKDDVKQYESRFLLKGEKGGRRYETLRVNHPLKIGHTKIFQMRYRVEVPRVEVMVYKDEKPLKRVTLQKGEALELPEAGLSVRYGEVVPDFRISRSGQVFSAGSMFRNPAVRFFIRAGGATAQKEESRWVFQDLLRMHEKEKGGPWDFSIVKIHKVYYSGVRVSHDPGIPWAYTGYVILAFFAFLSSFAIPRFLRVDIRPGVERTEISLQALSRRDTPCLLEELDRLAGRISS